MDHLKFDDLLRIAEAAGADSVHLESCRSCRDELDKVQALMATLHRGLGQDPPPATLARAAALLGRREQLAGAARRISRFLGELQLDSALTPTLAGARSAATTAAPRQLLFRAGDLDIDVAYTAETQTLRGQAMTAAGSDEAALRPVSLVADERVVDIAMTDERGGFRFDSVAPGAYELRLELADAEVAVRFELAGA